MGELQEALQWITACEGWIDHHEFPNEFQTIFKELLEMATPIKPIHRHALKQFGKCPACDTSVNITHHKGFCGKCGKALDWSE